MVLVRNIEQQEEKKTRRCKAPNHRLMNPTPSSHNFIPVPVEHSQEAIKTMVLLEMAKNVFYDDTEVYRFEPTEEWETVLKAERHCPPCLAVDGPYSAANGFLYAMLLSAINLQYCTTYILLRYLSKYVSSVDKARKIYVTANRDQETGLNLRQEIGYNTKITSNRIAENEAKKSQ